MQNEETKPWRTALSCLEDKDVWIHLGRCALGHELFEEGAGVVEDDAKELQELEQLPPAEEVKAEESVVVEAEVPAIKTEAEEEPVAASEVRVRFSISN